MRRRCIPDVLAFARGLTAVLDRAALSLFVAAPSVLAPAATCLGQFVRLAGDGVPAAAAAAARAGVLAGEEIAITKTFRAALVTRARAPRL